QIWTNSKISPHIANYKQENATLITNSDHDIIKILITNPKQTIHNNNPKNEKSHQRIVFNIKDTSTKQWEEYQKKTRQNNRPKYSLFRRSKKQHTIKMVKSYIKTNGEIESDIQHIESIIQEINNNGTLQITLITKNIVEDISRLEGWLSEIKRKGKELFRALCIEEQIKQNQLIKEAIET
ncbi:18375_t:CDS:2, partial [Entrophospora sp. SA101]